MPDRCLAVATLCSFMFCNYVELCHEVVINKCEGNERNSSFNLQNRRNMSSGYYQFNVVCTEHHIAVFR